MFPYSVIPHGAANGRELQIGLERDPVAAAHYAGFKTHSVRVIRLAKDRQAYVSYRLGNQIFWTKKKVMLHAGETLLTDGAHLARTRCANRISDVPSTPTSPAEPPAQVLQTPVVLPHPQPSVEPSPIVPVWVDSPEPPIVFFGANLPPNGGLPPSGNIIPFPVVPVCCTGESSPLTPPVYPPQPPPPVATPEPSSLLLLASGCAAALLLALRRRS